MCHLCHDRPSVFACFSLNLDLLQLLDPWLHSRTQCRAAKTDFNHPPTFLSSLSLSLSLFLFLSFSFSLSLSLFLCLAAGAGACRTFEGEEDGQEFCVTFTYTFPPTYVSGAKVYFAFCFPESYAECQKKLEACDARFAAQDYANYTPAGSNGDGPAEARGPPAPDDIYYRRELATKTLDGLRVDLITITSCHGMEATRESYIDGLFPEGKSTPRPHHFADKKVYFLSSRVHPGETPAAHVFNGFLKLILSKDDPRAVELRRLYVFKMIPILNPDGVRRGHYRTDSRGINLNRVYCTPNPEFHSPIFASRKVVDYYHQRGTLQFYMDLHAHASKRGSFVYGNALDGARHTENVLYARLIALNSAHFDFGGCSFAASNMFSRDKKDGLSKEGSGRVGTFLATNMTHVYTLESNYNTGRIVNALPPSTGDQGKCEKAPLAITPPPYMISHFEDVGRGVALAALDILGRNPWSRLAQSEHGSLDELRKHIGECIRSSRSKKGMDPAAMPRRVAVALRRQKALQHHNATHNGTTNNVRRAGDKRTPDQRRIDSARERGGMGTPRPNSVVRRTAKPKPRTPRSQRQPARSTHAGRSTPRAAPTASNPANAANATGADAHAVGATPTTPPRSISAVVTINHADGESTTDGTDKNTINAIINSATEYQTNKPGLQITQPRAAVAMKYVGFGGDSKAKVQNSKPMLVSTFTFSQPARLSTPPQGRTGIPRPRSASGRNRQQSRFYTQAPKPKNRGLLMGVDYSVCGE